MKRYELDRPLLEHVLIQLAIVQEALRDLSANGRGEHFRLPSIQGRVPSSSSSSEMKIGPASPMNGAGGHMDHD